MTKKLEDRVTYKNREGKDVKVIYQCTAENPLRPNVAHTGFTYYMLKDGTGNFGRPAVYYYGDGLWAGRVYNESRKEHDIYPEDIILINEFVPEQLSLFD